MTGRHRRRSTRESLFARFGLSCPVCTAPLGAPIALDRATGRFERAPTLQLSVGPQEADGTHSWQVSVPQVKFRPVRSLFPPFNSRDIEDVYLLCGSGHIFPFDSPVTEVGYGLRPGASQHRIDVWNMVAAIGAPASGKTYLMLRTLRQGLDNDDRVYDGEAADRIEARDLTPLEALPMRQRELQYHRTLSEGLPIFATGAFDGTPAGILQAEFEDVPEAIREIIRRTVRRGDRWARSWGGPVRQPIVLRADVQGRRTWTGVADLPGELFRIDPPEDVLTGQEQRSRAQRAKLRAYDALVWVVDPAVSGKAAQWLDLDDDEVAGSLHPDIEHQAETRLVRAERDRIQQEISHSLSLADGPFSPGLGARLEFLVAINKSDLIHDALLRKSLTELSTDVQRGAAGYLLSLAGQWAADGIRCDDQVGGLLEYINAGGADDVRRARAIHIAEGLLTWYSDPDEFWGLAHIGEETTVPIQSTGLLNLGRYEIRVPSIGEHLDAANARGSAYQLLTRDVVMSAVGCGVGYGLGLKPALNSALARTTQSTRFFLCSPLATVPTTIGHLIRPRDTTKSFPDTDDRSAALTQLLLAMLEKVREERRESS